jgi:fermentation-respiration switch protein FrsA (DUF1100 family)
VKSILITFALAYLAVLLVMALMQRRMTYFPGIESFTPREWVLPVLESLAVIPQSPSLGHTDDVILSSWYRAPKSPEKLTIVFFQGNGGHVGYRNTKVKPWLRAGYGVLLVGYPGYGGNPGSPTETSIYEASRGAIKKVIESGVNESRLVFYGESIGTGSATQMATEFNKAAGLILEAPFTSLPDAGAYHYPYLPVRLLMRDRFDSRSKIGRVNMPLLLIHGEKDRVVPVAQGRKLVAAANEPKRAVIISDAGHNDLYDRGAASHVMDFLSSLQNY